MLKEVRNLPQELTDNLNRINLNVCLVINYDNDLLKRLVSFSLDIFGELGMNEWGLVPQIRHGQVYVLKENDSESLVGLAILMRDWDDLEKAYLFDYAIAKEFQGKGLGYYFLLAINHDLKAQGFKKVELTVDTENAPAIRLYKEKVGFKVLSTNKNEYGEGHNRLIMETDI